MKNPRLLLLMLGVALIGATGAGLLLGVPGSTGSAHIARINLLVGLMTLAAVIYFAAVRIILRHAWPRGTVWAVLAVFVCLRILVLTEPPFLSSDIYRYVWDGRVQAAGINPYRYVPADPALSPLRDTVIYPHINRATYARTIYPPAAELVFAAVGRIWDSVLGMRLAMLGFEALGVACALALLRLAGLPRERILIYAWNPLPLWSFACDGHVDAIAVGLLGLALLLRARHRDGSAGAVLAGAVLVKFFPVVVAPAFLRGGRFWRPALAGIAVIAACYGLYLGAGAHVLGFLPAYTEQEGIATGGGIWLLAGLSRIVTLPVNAPIIYVACVAAVFMVLTVAILRQPPPRNDVKALCRDTGTLAAVSMVAISPHYHWYFAWLALPAVIAPSHALLWLATASLLLVISPIPNDDFIWPSLVYIPALLLLLADLHRSRAMALPSPARPGDIACPRQSP